MPQLAPQISSVPASGIRRIMLLASELDNVISLEVGEPDVTIAAHIAAAAKAAWDRDDTNYSANSGIAPLREAIVEKLARENGLRVDVEQVWVTVGATQGLHQAMHLLLAAGDEVLVPDPGYTVFSMTPRMLDAVPVPYPLRADRGFMPSIEELDSLVSERTRVIVINSPSNPLGTVFPEPVLRELLDFARRHDLWIISDEVYEYFTWGEPHVSIGSFDEDGRVFTAFSLSKTYAMTGIRVGYLVTPPGLAPVMRSVQETSISCVNTPAQYAALAAITGSQQAVSDARAHYRENLDAATALLDARGIHYLPPRGTFYLWVDVSHVSRGDVADWAERFLVEERVAIAPGSAFGRSGEGWIRVNLATEADALMAGLGLNTGAAGVTGRRIVIAGASGFVGTYLVERFRRSGDSVSTIGRGASDARWGDTDAIAALIDGADVLINLAGKSVNCRYTTRNRAAIFSSRLLTTAELGDAVMAVAHPPAVWLNASTATIYRHADDKPMTEKKGALGKGFSVNVATAWEREFFAHPRAGVRQVALRMAIVLGDGSALRPLVMLTRLGLGGPQFGGKTKGARQRFSWVHIEDVYRAIEFLIVHPDLNDAVNVASPNPVDNRELMATLRRVLGVRVFIPLFAWMLEIGAFLMRTETELLLKSRWVIPKRLTDAGFEFEFPSLEGALRDILHREKP